MKRLTELLSGSAAVLFQVAFAGWMFALSEINFEFNALGLAYLPLSAPMLAAYYIDILMLRRGVPVPVFAVVQAVFVALGAVVFVRNVTIEPYVLRTVIINCIIYCLGFAVAAFIAWAPTNQNGILLRFDCLAIMIVIMMVLDHVLALVGASGVIGMCFVVLAITLIASISLKAGALTGRGSAVQGNPALGRIMLAVAFVIAGILALLLVAYATAGVKNFSEFLMGLITVCVDAVKAVLRFLYEMLERFAQWLSQFVKDEPMVGVGIEGGMSMELPAGEDEEMPLPAWIYYFLAAIAAAVIGIIIFRLRRVRTVKLHTRAVTLTAVRRESRLASALRELWEKLCTELRFRFNCLRYRRSCAGLLIWCEKKAPEELRRRRDESGERYLSRLASAVDSESADHLNRLAQLVERSFYSPVPASVPADLYRAVRKTKFKSGKEKE